MQAKRATAPYSWLSGAALVNRGPQHPRIMRFAAGKGQSKGPMGRRGLSTGLSILGGLLGQTSADWRDRSYAGSAREKDWLCHTFVAGCTEMTQPIGGSILTPRKHIPNTPSPALTRRARILFPDIAATKQGSRCSRHQWKRERGCSARFRAFLIDGATDLLSKRRNQLEARPGPVRTLDASAVVRHG